MIESKPQAAPCPTAIPADNWRSIVRKYQEPCLKKSIWQLTNTLLPYLGIWWLMFFTHQVSWPLTLLLASIAGLFLVRIFIIFHDCGHGSYFKSKKANDYLGFMTGILTLTPYRHWRWQHAVHHGASGNLDARGIGDVWTMTINEYKASPIWIRMQYRFTRNPIVLFVLVPLGLFLVYQRFAYSKANKRDRRDVYIMNACIAVYATALSLIFGFWNFLWIQLTVTGVSGSLGVWLFYVQHQFEDTYWRKADEWDYTESAMKGSSFYRLPRTLNWFSGNIGYHHIHHLSSRIPNYNLPACHYAEEYFQKVPELTLLSSIKSLHLRLWDEENHKLVGYSGLRNSNIA